jgi:hypothetical protein
MNSIDEYQAEIAYRREQMLLGRRSIRSWRRARSAAAALSPKNRNH